MQILKKILAAIAFLLLISACFLLVFPTISNLIRTKNNNTLIAQFDLIVSANTNDDNTNTTDKNKEPIESLDLERLYTNSLLYNKNVKDNQYKLLSSVSYSYPALDLSEYGIKNNMYGYITAPDINMNLPIYLGTNNQTMSNGAAHLSYTSLPIGGSNTNTVLAGHTGYVGQVFFDNIKKLNIGDTVTVTNYWGKLNYKVTDCKTCAPTDAADIYITDGKDKLTLITCINNGTDRYVLICERS